MRYRIRNHHQLRWAGLILCLFVLCSFYFKLNFVHEGEEFVIKSGPVKIQVDPKKGGRITKFLFGVREVLLQEEKTPDFYGSTFWTSPQADWGWPPYKTLDSDPYDVLKIDSTFLCIQSKIEPKTKLQVKKYFYSIAIDTAILIKYVVVNTSQSNSISLAPWEVTRVPSRGLLFFPSSDKQAANMYKSETKFFKYKDGYFGLYLNAGKVAKNFKLFEDGDGKVAYINDSLLFVKTYPDIKPEKSAVDESEIELFINVDQHYLEIEQQGELKTLRPGDSLTWQVKWYLREYKLPVITKTDTSLKLFGDQLLKPFR